MSNADMVRKIIHASARPALGYHQVIHLEPSVFQTMAKEEGLALGGAVIPVGRPSGIYFEGAEVIIDMGTAYAEVTIEPDRPRKRTWLDRINDAIERWEERW